MIDNIRPSNPVMKNEIARTEIANNALSFEFQQASFNAAGRCAYCGTGW
jgi:hypothetical protein